MIVPWDQLSAEALVGVIEEFVTRDGTELSDVAAKARAVRKQLEQGRVVLVFDPETETCNLIPREEVRDG